MKEHRHNYGTSGNCFDLALRLIHEFSEAGIESSLFTSGAHVAVIAIYNGYKLVVQPILIDPGSSEFSEDLLDLFFPAAEVRV